MFFAVFSTKFAKKAQFCTIFAKKTANFLHVSEIISIFAPSKLYHWAVRMSPPLA